MGLVGCSAVALLSLALAPPPPPSFWAATAIDPAAAATAGRRRARETILPHLTGTATGSSSSSSTGERTFRPRGDEIQDVRRRRRRRRRRRCRRRAMLKELSLVVAHSRPRASLGRWFFIIVVSPSAIPRSVAIHPTDSPATQVCHLERVLPRCQPAGGNTHSTDGYVTQSMCRSSFLSPHSFLLCGPARLVRNSSAA